MSKLKALKDIFSFNNKTVVVGVDFNVPLDENGNILDNYRIVASVPTIRYLLDSGAHVVLISHLGRPNKRDDKLSLLIVKKELEGILMQPVEWLANWPNEKPKTRLSLAENLRFLDGEIDADSLLAKTMADGVDVFVMDAFGCTHRKHASTFSIMNYVTDVCVGLLVEKELEAIKNILQNSNVTLVVGGAKIASKLSFLKTLIPLVDNVLLAGGVANTFLKAAGYNIGSSLYDKDYIQIAKNMLQKNKGIFTMPVDVRCAKSTNEDVKKVTIDEVGLEDKIFDIGVKTWAKFKSVLEKSEVVVWAGPLGFVEKEQYRYGSNSLADYLATSSAFTVVGGGDTAACIEPKLRDKINIISTGGGAFLAALNSLPIALEHEKLREDKYAKKN